MFWYGDYYSTQIYAFADLNSSKWKLFNEGKMRKLDFCTFPKYASKKNRVL